MLSPYWHGVLIYIRQINKILIACLIVFIAAHSVVRGQNGIDSLRSILDHDSLPGNIVVKTSLELCKALIKSDKEYLLPEYAIKGINADTLTKDHQSKFALYELLGNYYWQTGRLSEAAEQFSKMRLIGETIGDTKITAYSYNGLGNTYYLMDSWETALDYYRKGLALSGTDTLLKVRLYNNIANSFISLKQMDSVLLYYNKTVEYHIAHNNYRYLSSVYANIALTYEELHNGPALRKYIDLALETAVKSNDPYQIASVYQNMGELAFKNHPDLAMTCYEKSLEIARKSKNFDQILQALQNISELSQQKGDYQRANQYLRAFKNLDDSLDLELKKSRLQQLEYNHLTELKRIEEDKKVHQHELKMLHEQNRQKVFLIIISGVLLALSVLLVMGFQVYRLRMKISRSKDEFFKMIAHDIRSPFSGILGLSEVLNEEANLQGDPHHKKHLESLHKSLTHVYDLLENLLQWAQSKSKKSNFKPQFQLVLPVVEEVIHLYQASGKQKGVQIVPDIPFGVAARFDTNMLQTILRNLLSNAIKFSPESSTINISAKTQDKEVLVSISDQGIGMNADQVDRILKSDERFSTPGTRNETGTGLGLILCKRFIHIHGGKMNIESKPRFGTTISFTLPD